MMDFKVKTIPIATGVVPVVVLNREACAELDFHLGERVKVTNPKNGREVIAVVDFYDNKKLRKDTIALMEEVSALLGIKEGMRVQISREDSPVSLSYIKGKLNGRTLTATEIATIIEDIVKGRITSIEMTYFVSACYAHGLSTSEVIALTRAIVETGEKLDLRASPQEHIYDKHCVGGVAGNRTTMCVIPIIAAYGLKIPKTSSRAITSPAGTADTMEVLAEVSLSAEKLQQVVQSTNACIVWGGALNLAPADDKILRIEHPLSIDTDGLMLASILAKKFSVGSTDILIDIPVAEHAKVKTWSRARLLRKQFTTIGRALGMNIKIILTDGSSPIGNGVGPLLEAIDVLKVLRNDIDAPKDLRAKTILMATELLAMHLGNRKKAQQAVVELLQSGRAYEKFMDIIAAQGKKKLPQLAKFHHTFTAQRKGVVRAINNHDISRMARFCGAPKTKEAGVYLHKKVGDIVQVGDALVTLYANNEQSLDYAKEYYEKNKVYAIQ